MRLDTEVRVSAGCPEIRSAGETGTRQVVGYAAVFNREAVIANNFREKILPGAFRSAMATSDVRALFNHDASRVLGRAKAGTLRLTEDEIGLRYEIDLNPDDPEAMSLAAKIQRGDISGSSFRFKVAREGQTLEPAERMGQLPLRTVSQYAEIIDVGPVTFPAYDETTSEVRDMAAALMQSETRDDSAKTDDKNKTASGKEGKHYAGTDGKSYPITDPIDVYNAAHAIGRDTKGDADREKVKANIIRIAYELGPKYVAQLPEDWKHKADQKTDAARSAAATEKYWEQRDAEEQAELIAYTAIKGLLTDIAGHLASAQAAADSLIANETHDPADGGSQAEADEEAIETAQLRSLYVLCNQIASAANGIAGLVQGELCYDPVMYRSAQIADADRTRRLALESAKAAR